jgi:RNA polymerase sigma-70 factor (ECF subfamily)
MLLVSGPSLPIREPSSKRATTRGKRMTMTAHSESSEQKSTREEARLVSALARGDQAALAALYDQLAGPLYSLAVRMLGNTAQAQELVQDAFLQLWHAADTFPTGRGSLFAWSVTQVRRRAVDRIRIDRHRGELPAQTAPGRQPAAPVGASHSLPLWLREKAAAIHAGYLNLPAGQRQAIESAYFDGLTVQEISGHLNAPLGTAKADIHQGLLKLTEPFAPPFKSEECHGELTALHVLGLLDDAERSTLATEMTLNPELTTRVESFGETVAHLALVAPQVAPPSELRSRIVSAVSAPADAPAIDSPLFRSIPWAVAAILTLAAIWLGLQNLSLRTENDASFIDRRLAEIAYRAAQNQLAERSLLAERMINDLGRRLQHAEDLARLRISVLASFGSTRKAQAIAVWDPGQQAGLLTCDMLPAPADNQDYQIWIVDPAYPTPVNCGVFRPDAAGHAVLVFRPDQPVRQAAAFAISLEKKGGAAKAEGAIILLGQVTGS